VRVNEGHPRRHRISIDPGIFGASMSDLQGRAAVITGGETGIGLAISSALAAAGADVFIGGLLEEAGAKAVEQIRQAGQRAEFRRTDVRVADQIEALIAAASAKSARLDIMVNNAGVFDGFASCLETTERLWDQVININLKGCFLGCQAALRRMVPQRGGRIINMSSVGGLRGAADGLAYTASKFGIIGVTRQVACSYAEYGITVNAICPGVIATDIRRNSATILGGDAPNMQRGVGTDPDAYKLLVPAKRRGLTSEVAAAVLFLASDSAAYINGQALAVDGGWSAT
jgi:NAD(P)-dependent dehydrogenase (short-subunit alcohol dehydrogenase family)